MWLPTRNCADIDTPYNTFNAAAYASAGHTRIIIKATQGTTWVNDRLTEWVRWAHEQGMSVGFYHYADVTELMADKEVNHFIRFAKPLAHPGDIYHLDLETGIEKWSRQAVGKWGTQFCNVLARATRQHPIPYMNEDYYHQLAGHFSTPGNQYWLAAYGPRAPRTRRRETLWGWQFTDGKIGPFPHGAAGIGLCDLSRLKTSQVAADYLRMLRRRRSLKRPHC